MPDSFVVLDSTSDGARQMTTYSFTQATAAQVWTINHNLNCNPVVDVQVLYEGAVQKILPTSIEFPTTSQVIVSFSSPRTGTARCA
jgi:hypothetical protein